MNSTERLALRRLDPLVVSLYLCIFVSLCRLDPNGERAVLVADTFEGFPDALDGVDTNGWALQNFGEKWKGSVGNEATYFRLKRDTVAGIQKTQPSLKFVSLKFQKTQRNSEKTGGPPNPL